jgi:hypothetical protein
MPCRVDPTPEELAQEARRREQAITGPLHEEISVLKEELKEREAMLCGVLSALTEMDCATHMILTSDQMPLKIVRDAMPVWYDQHAAGVSWLEVQSWWEDHKERDAERRAQEAAQREIKRRAILARLSAEDREILGV